MKFNAKAMHQLYGFDVQESGLAALNGKLHPIHEKHLNAVKKIMNVYELLSNNEISKGKAEELIAGVIEHFTKATTTPPGSFGGQSVTGK